MTVPAAAPPTGGRRPRSAGPAVALLLSLAAHAAAFVVLFRPDAPDPAAPVAVEVALTVEAAPADAPAAPTPQPARVASIDGAWPASAMAAAAVAETAVLTFDRFHQDAILEAGWTPPPAAFRIRPEAAPAAPGEAEVMPLSDFRPAPAQRAGMIPPSRPPAAVKPATVLGSLAPAAGPGPVEPPRFAAPGLLNPAPAYPPAARRRGIEGEVWLGVLVSPEGAPLQVEVRRSSGAALLDAAAVEAVWRWRFLPARQGGQAVAATVQVPIAFRLEEG